MKMTTSLMALMTFLSPFTSGTSSSKADTVAEAITDDDRVQKFLVWKLPVGVEESYLIAIDEKNKFLNTGETACFYPTDPSTMFLFSGMTKSKRFCLILLKDEKIISTRVITLGDEYQSSFDWPQLKDISPNEKDTRDAIRIVKQDAEKRGADQPAYAPQPKPENIEKKPNNASL
jgi:hypothetical protein